ncbi:histone deacetylase [Cryptotrichosporon argae]
MVGPSTAPEATLGLFIQPACLQHRYIRHANASHIFERPERLRAVLLGVAAAVARLEQDAASSSSSTAGNDDLAALLSSLSLGPPPLLALVPPPPQGAPGQVLLHHPALHLAHSPPPEMPLALGSGAHASSPYLRNLFTWASEAVEMIKATGSEIPQGLGLNQGDLYLGPGSIVAIEGAIQTVCQAVDRICAGADKPSPPSASEHDTPATDRPFSKAFCAIRPPGHHCGEDEPSGFCYVNNVVVGAMHAYLQHDIDRAIIIDFDLHHGNGTQALVMPLNAASHAEDIAVAAGKPPTGLRGKDGRPRRGWKGFYGSVHDIYSYPCEDGDVDIVKDASISLAAHGQYIENIHLQPYSSEDDFYERIYPKYLALLDKARVFMQETGGEADKTVVFISAGFDACEHEHQAMQRHDRRVPTSFFTRYTRDIVAFANAHAAGRVVSVLEGGYSDRALTSAAMGHAVGLLDRPGHASWWAEPELVNIEKAIKRKRTGKLNPPAPDLAPHLARTHALLSLFETGDAAPHPPPSAPASAASTPRERMTLRERRKVADDDADDVAPTLPPPGRRGRKAAPGAATASVSLPSTPKRDAASTEHAIRPVPVPVPVTVTAPDIQVSVSSLLPGLTPKPTPPAPAPVPARSPRKSLPRSPANRPAGTDAPPLPPLPPPPAASGQHLAAAAPLPARPAPPTLAETGADANADLDGAIAALALVSLGSAEAGLAHSGPARSVSTQPPTIPSQPAIPGQTEHRAESAAGPARPETSTGAPASEPNRAQPRIILRIPRPTAPPLNHAVAPPTQALTSARAPPPPLASDTAQDDGARQAQRHPPGLVRDSSESGSESAASDVSAPERTAWEPSAAGAASAQSSDLGLPDGFGR